MSMTLSNDASGAPEGYSYTGLLVRARRDAVLDTAGELRFTGWVGPQEGAWVVLVPARSVGPVAGAGAVLDRFGADLAAGLDAAVISADVHRDRVLRLGLWTGEREVGHYLSDPSYGALEDDEVFPEPEGVELAGDLAAVAGSPEAAEPVAELLGETLDEESEIESERLTRLFDALGLPRWLVAASALPHDVPGGPQARELTRLGAGQSGPVGRLRGWGTGAARRVRARLAGLTRRLRRTPG